MTEKEIYFREAGIIGRYLLPFDPDENKKLRYAEAMDHLRIRFSERENKIWNFVMKFPAALGPVDAVLALKDPEGNIRRKLFVMLAILEAGTDHTAYFLPKKYSIADLANIVFAGIRAVFRLVTGLLILAFL